MTGQKNRYTTTEKLWKLDDETLTTPKHDEMVMYLLNKDNMDYILNEHLNIKTIEPNLYMVNMTLYEPVIENIQKYYISIDYKRNGIYNTFLIDLLNNENKEKYEQHIINLWDELRLDAESAFGIINDSSPLFSSPLSSYNIESEKPIIIKYNKFIVGYTDIYLNFKREIYDLRHFNLTYNFDEINDWCIEVKPNIKSFGQTLRQLKTYQEYLPENTVMCLLTSDTKFKKAFESQGIKVLIYPNE